MIRKNHKWLKNYYFRCPLENFIIFLPLIQSMVVSNSQEMRKIISLLVILNCVYSCRRNLKIPARCKVVCGCEWFISTKILHSLLISWRDWYLKNWNIKVSMLKTEGLVKKKIAYMKHIKIHWCHMDVIFMSKRLIWKSLQCMHILILIMHYHTVNVSCDAVLNIHVSIILTKKHMVGIHTQHPQLGFTFITYLCAVLLLVELH